MNSQKRTILTLSITVLSIVALTTVWLAFTENSKTTSFNYSKDKSSFAIEGLVPQEEFEQIIEEQALNPKTLEAEILYPVGEIITTSTRKKYIAESMELVIPKLKLRCAVQDGTDDKTLENGPGLYEYAQLPSINNSNVSIAGHRDIHGSHFYYLDTLSEGDLVYLTYDNQIFEYTFLDSKIITADDWQAIQCKDISCVTLTTCDPIGTSLNRLVVTAQLAAIYPYSDTFDKGI